MTASQTDIAMVANPISDLTDDEIDLIAWLSRDVGQYGECRGITMDRLHELGLVGTVCDDIEGGHPAVWPPPSDFYAVDLVSNWCELVSPQIAAKVNKLNREEWGRRYQ